MNRTPNMPGSPDDLHTRSWSLGPALLSVLMSILLTACGSVERRPVIERDTRPTVVAPPVVAQPGTKPPATPVPSRQGATPGRGGYYKDDGPGDNPPDSATLAAIPEPEPRVEPLHRFANNPYNVFGVDYVPLKTLAPFRQRGLGSWYGRKFHGQRTSSGEPYDMYAMTAAHPTLPIPSYVRVTNTTNRREVVVRVNDRGPFHPGRVIDLSYAAAWKLGYVGAGSSPVEVELLTPDQYPEIIASLRTRNTTLAKAVNTPTPVAASESVIVPATQTVPVSNQGTTPSAAPREPAPMAMDVESAGVFLQLGAFSGRDNAESFRARVYRELGWLNDTIQIVPRDGLFRLHLGPYKNRTDASSMADRIRTELEIKPVVVTR